MLKRITIIVCLTGLLLASTPVLAAQSPTERVKEGIQEIIDILSNPEMTQPEYHDKAVSVLRQTAKKYISFKLATMYSVGRPWLKMSPKVQDELVEAFTDLLECTYLQRIPSYGGENVFYENEIIQGTRAKVMTKIEAKDKTYSVEFRLKNMNGTWMIYDTIAEGISLVGNYRSQFAKQLAEGTPEELVQKLRDRACQIEAEGPEGQESKQ